MTIHQALSFAHTLLKKNSTSPYLDAQILLGFVLKERKEFLLTYPENQLTTRQETAFKKLIKRRHAGEPVAYLTEMQAFYGKNFYVTSSVLIPRPETEQLVDETIKAAKSLKQKKVSIVDLGTGSGVVAICVKNALGTAANVTATDISKRALAIAQKNSKTFKTTITFKHGSLLKPLKQMPNILVANLPYVPILETKKRSKLTASLIYEPAKALYAENKGLALFEKIFTALSKYQQLPSVVLLEIGHDQGPTIKRMSEATFPWAKTKIMKDFCGKDRIIKIKL